MHICVIQSLFFPPPFMPPLPPFKRFFSRLRATLWPALSVYWSVGRSRLALFVILRQFKSLFPSFYVILSCFKLYKDNLHLVFSSFGLMVSTTTRDCNCKVLALFFYGTSSCESSGIFVPLAAGKSDCQSVVSAHWSVRLLQSRHGSADFDDFFRRHWSMLA